MYPHLYTYKNRHKIVKLKIVTIHMNEGGTEEAPPLPEGLKCCLTDK